ncbi:MAG: aldo/keto reductase [Deltaproteobacteria bacterium]|nr:aldo/keto reductase [Deltaproteobacteria bacterium]MBW2694823.1 aldo/keto reductase [Deltaproteobacteria bacterium]
MKSRPGLMALGAGIASIAIGFVVSGHYMWNAAIGLDPSAFPAGEFLQRIGLMLFPNLDVAVGGLLLALLSLLGLAVISFFLVRAARIGAVVQADPARRTFLTGSLAGLGAGSVALAAGAFGAVSRFWFGVGHGGMGWEKPLTQIFGGDVVKTHPEWKDVWRGSRVQSYGRLGRTEWPVSDTVLGTGPLKGELGEQVTRLALERGINYIDTAPDYSASGSEQAVGRAIKNVPRESFFLATKFCTPTGHLPPGTPVDVYKKNIQESLARLGTDYVDLIHVHSCDEVDRLMDPNMHEAFGQLKQEGKARFLGFSTHTPNLLEVANTAIDSGKFDVMMLAYHHGIWPAIGSVIERARREQDMGVVAMKTLKGAKHKGLEGRGVDSYAQAALKWVHADPNVSCAVISFFELQHVDEYLYASGGRPASADLALLQKYDALTATTYCKPHCGVCLGACPEKVRIDDVLRHRMYFEDYRNEQMAMRLYEKLEKNASVCLDCSAPCTGSCPYGIQIQERMLGAHELLTA